MRLATVGESLPVFVEEDVVLCVQFSPQGSSRGFLRRAVRSRPSYPRGRRTLPRMTTIMAAAVAEEGAAVLSARRALLEPPPLVVRVAAGVNRSLPEGEYSGRIGSAIG